MFVISPSQGMLLVPFLFMSREINCREFRTLNFLIRLLVCEARIFVSILFGFMLIIFIIFVTLVRYYFVLRTIIQSATAKRFKFIEFGEAFTLDVNILSIEISTNIARVLLMLMDFRFKSVLACYVRIRYSIFSCYEIIGNNR